jgi:hypothetical protein
MRGNQDPGAKGRCQVNQMTVMLFDPDICQDDQVSNQAME